MWRICRDIGKEWFTGFHRLTHKLHSLIKKDIGAVARETFPTSISDIGIVEIVIAPKIRHRSYVGGREPEGFMESPVFRPERIIISEMPLPEDAGQITIFGKHICHG